MTAGPKLRDDLVVVEQRYRGERAYIVKDPRTHKYFRFKPVELLVMRQLNGDATPAELAAALTEQGIPVSAGTIEGFTRKLRRMDLLERSLAEKSVLLLERLRAERRRRVRGTHYRGSLLRMRWSVGDPDRVLDRWMPHFRFCFAPPFLVASVALFLVYAAIAASHLPEIGRGVLAFYTAEFYTLQNVVLFWLVATIVVAIHELGHAFACKHFGGHVHELGAMLIYFQPAFYCNVNDAWTFADRRHRLWVTAAGSWIQLVLAALAAIVWVTVAPDTVVSRAAFFAVLIGGGTTVLANANPLIPLDGYYALSDYLEIPNLRQRAFGYLGWLVKRHVLRLDLPKPPADERERRVFVLYGVLAAAYITIILTLFGALVFGWAWRALGAIGAATFLLLLWAALRRPVREWGRAIVTAVRERRATRTGSRTRGRLALGVGAALLVLLLVPWPIGVSGRFVASPAADATLASPEEDALVDRVYVREGGLVEAGTPLVRLRHLGLERELIHAGWRADSVAALVRAARGEGRGAEAERLEVARAELGARRDGLARRHDALTLRAPWRGVMVTLRPEELVGCRFEAGEVVVRVARLDTLDVRVELAHGGAAVRPGQAVSLIGIAVGRTLRAAVLETAPASGTARAVTARVRVPATPPAWTPGVTGRARVTLRRSNLLGAIWWAVRQRLRNDLLL